MEKININEIIYKWFEMKYQTYDKLEYEDSIYLYYVGQEYAEIRIDKKSKYIFYKWELYKEFSEIISLYSSEFEEFINKWVGDTFGLKGFTPSNSRTLGVFWLKIPLI